MAHGELLCYLPESTGKCLPCQDVPSRGQERMAPSSLRPPRSPTDSSNLAAANLTRAPSHHSHSSSLSGSPGPGASGSHATPASPAPSWLSPPAQPRTPRQPVPGRARTRRPPGEVFLESGRAPGRAPRLTCVFFIRKGCAVLQPRQRCGDSV